MPRNGPVASRETVQWMHDFVALGDGVIDGEIQIGKCLSAFLDMIFDVLNSGVQVGENRIVKPHPLSKEFGGRVHVPSFQHSSTNL